TEEEKVQIAVRHLLPKQIKEHGLSKEMLRVSENTIRKITREYTRESGVRNLERQIATICRKTARQVVTDKIKKLRVTSQNLNRFLGSPRFRYGVAELDDQVGVATGLAWTEVGGDTLAIEVSVYKGTGRLTLTGKLGDVMKESAQAGYSYVRSRAAELNIDEDLYDKQDIHIHIPEGAIPKDGPSAGITMASALASAITGRKVRHDVAMTGEITLRGRVLPIGGVKEKILAAHRAGIKTVILPNDNKKDLDEIPKKVKDKMKFILVDHMDQVLETALTEREYVPAPITADAPVMPQPPAYTPAVVNEGGTQIPS
ncbi:MAG: magnesium chelatase domain-containing protein, partial [Desulfotomaculaceae bacterium]|nr:magnesium chelatase domain-containing protein [Desulfotomaculaceae bacterium]